MLIYLVEDDPVQVFVTSTMIKQSLNDVELLHFPNGKVAFEDLQTKIAQAQPLPDVIFLDINMPVWDGWKFLDEFEKQEFSSKVYILTSSMCTDDKIKAEAHGLSERYLVKPISTKTIKSIFGLE